jgi:hypothetical protein
MDELDSLITQAAGVDAEVASTAPAAMVEQQAAAAVMDMAQQNCQGVSMMLGLAVPILSKLYPSLENVYTEQACAQIAASVGPVLAKYNVNLADWGSSYKEEIGALFVCGPIAWATVQAVKADIAARNPAKAVAVTPVEEGGNADGSK